MLSEVSQGPQTFTFYATFLPPAHGQKLW